MGIGSSKPHYDSYLHNDILIICIMTTCVFNLKISPQLAGPRCRINRGEGSSFDRHLIECHKNSRAQTGIQRNSEWNLCIT